MKILKNIIGIKNRLTYKQKVWLLAVCGVIVGLGGYFMYLLRAHTYFINDNPSACVNCHIMTPYYATWSHSSHARDVTCNDCHVPHHNPVVKYGFKAVDGLKHTFYFITKSEGQTVMAEPTSAGIIMENCIRCHAQLNQEFVNTGRIDYMMAKSGEGKACWDCHRNVPHDGMNSLMSTPNAECVTPLPPSPVPQWLHGILETNN